MPAAAGRLRIGNNQSAFGGTELGQMGCDVVGGCCGIEPVNAPPEDAKRLRLPRNLGADIRGHFKGIAETIRRVRFQS